jgi:DNA topoisomerase I
MGLPFIEEITLSKLVIVESPAKAKTINRYLGRDYKVRASMGHVRDLPKSKLGVDIEDNFNPTYRALAGRKKVLDELKKLAKDADQIFLATDLDREGEAIAWHLAEALKVPAKKLRRVIFNEITKTAIRAAFKKPLELDMDKVNAQQARRILDRIVGYQLSPLLWSKIRRGLSAGRVQSVVVRLIVERERAIEAFNPEEYWELHADLAAQDASADDAFRAKLAKLKGKPVKLGDEAVTTALVEGLTNLPFTVTSVKEKQRVLKPSAPFNTSSLQQQASIKLRFSSKKTMMLAQQLYEGVELGEEEASGLITYMRTDSFNVSDDALNECRAFIGDNFDKDYLPEKPNVYAARKSAQEAHEAVRPTSSVRTPEMMKQHLTKDQFRLYELIWNRFIASQMMPGKLSVNDVQITAGDAIFNAQGRRLAFDGHLKIMGYKADSDTTLPELTEGQIVNLLKLDPSQHFTKPPPRYTEATLVKILEKFGIGRPSTYAPIITTIQDRSYVELAKRQFSATDLGKLVNDQLVEHFKDIVNVEFTSQMEQKLDKVEEAKVEWTKALHEFYEPFSVDLEKAKKNMKRAEPEVTEHKCPDCEKFLLRRWGRQGPFLGCQGYPECKFTSPMDAEGKPAPRPKPETLEEKCPECSEPLLKRHGRHGPFIGCSGYPKCKFVRSLDTPIEIPDDLKKCEKCDGEMTVRRSRRGPFLGCSNYPKCRGTKPIPKEILEKQKEDAEKSDAEGEAEAKSD